MNAPVGNAAVNRLVRHGALVLMNVLAVTLAMRAIIPAIRLEMALDAGNPPIAISFTLTGRPVRFA